MIEMFLNLHCSTDIDILKCLQIPEFEIQDSECTHTNPFNYFDRVGRIFHSDLVILRPVVVVNCCANVAYTVCITHSLTL